MSVPTDAAQTCGGASSTTSFAEEACSLTSDGDASMGSDPLASLEGKPAIVKPASGRSSAAAHEEEAVGALAALQNYDRNLRLDGLPASSTTVAHVLARDTELSPQELLEMDASRTAERLQNQNGLTRTQTRAVREGVEMAAAVKVASETRDRVIQSLERSHAKVESTLVTMRELHTRLNGGERLTRETLATLLRDAGASADDVRRLVPDESRPLTRGAVAHAEAFLREVRRGHERVLDAVRNPHLDVRHFLHDPRFASTRDEVLRDGGVHLSDPDFQASMRQLGRPVDGRALADDVMFGAGFAGPIGAISSTIYSLATATLDASMLDERAEEARAMRASGLVDDAFVREADGAGVALIMDTVQDVIRSKVLDDVPQIMLHVYERTSPGRTP